jgi:hypothetical protein
MLLESTSHWPREVASHDKESGKERLNGYCPDESVDEIENVQRRHVDEHITFEPHRHISIVSPKDLASF